MEILKCKRCGKIISEKKYMIQVIVYLGTEHHPRKELCDECYASFVKWFDEMEDIKE